MIFLKNKEWFLLKARQHFDFINIDKFRDLILASKGADSLFLFGN